jgi:hypothetical protein
VVVLAVALIVVAVAGVFAIAATTIGREAHRLDAVAPRTVYNLDDAIAYVADALPLDSQARLTHDDVEQLLRWHMAQLHGEGLQPSSPFDQVQDIDRPVVVEEAGTAGYLIGRAEAEGLDVEDVDVVRVVEAHLEYFDAIGAVGPEAPEV